MAAPSLLGFILVANGQLVFVDIHPSLDVVPSSPAVGQTGSQAPKLPPIAGYSNSVIAATLSPKAALYGQPFDVALDNLHFAGRPLSLASTKGASKHSVQSFNIVLISRDPCLFVKEMLLVTERLALALKYEEERCQYLSKEVRSMTMARDDWVQHVPLTDLTNVNIANMLVKTSTLAAMLRSVFISLESDKTCHLTLNGWMTVSVSLLHVAEVNTDRRPYQTLLLTDDSATILRALPPDSSSELNKLIRNANPRSSFSELQLKTGVGLAQLYRLSDHLVQWGKARIIDYIAPHHIYVLTPTALPNAPEWDHMFPSFNLLNLLERFSLPHPISEHLKSIEVRTHEEFFRALSYLLRTNRIEQLRTFVTLVMDDKTPPPDRGPLTSQENTILHRKVDDESTRELLIRIAALLRGEFDIDEICWRGGVERTLFEQLLQQHDDFLVTYSLSSSNL